MNRGKSHSYYLGDERIPGVTTILGDGVPKPALTKWSARLVAEYAADHIDELRALGSRNAIVGALEGVPWDQLHQAAARGTDIHRLAEQLLHGLEVDVPEEFTGHVDAYIRFLQDWEPRDELIECVVGSRKHKYAGTLDLIATLRDGQRWMIDWKTGRNGPFPEVALQLAGYRFAEVIIAGDGTERPMEPVDRCGVVWVTTDSYQFYPVEAGELQWRTFLYVQQVARFTKNSKHLVGEALTPGLAFA